MEHCLYYRNKGASKKIDPRWGITPVSEIRPVPPATTIKPYDRILVKSEPDHVCFAFEFGKQSTLRAKASKVAPAIEKEMDKMYSTAKPITATFDSQKKIKPRISTADKSKNKSSGSNKRKSEKNPVPKSKKTKQLDPIQEDSDGAFASDISIPHSSTPKADKKTSKSLSSPNDVVELLPDLSKKILDADDSFPSNYLQHATDVAKILAVLDNYIYKLINNLEPNKCTPRLWNFERYKISALEHGLVQCFHTDREGPVSDEVLELEFKEKAVKEGEWRCKAENCGCDPAHIFDTKLSCIQHLQRRFVTYICMACSFKFNSRSYAVAHGRSSCDYWQDTEKCKVKHKLKATVLKSFVMEIAKDGDEDQDENEEQEGENEYSFDSFIEFAVNLTAETKLKLDKKFASKITSLSDFDRFQLRAKYFILKKLFEEKFSSSIAVEICGSSFIIYHDENHAFQVVNKASCEPIACWELKLILMKSWYKRSGRYFCDYEFCVCEEYSSSSKTQVLKHIQNTNFLLVCRACNLGFCTQSTLEHHFTKCELP